MGPIEFKEKARYYLDLMSYLAASAKLDLHLHTEDRKLQPVAIRLHNLGQDILAKESSALREFLSNYKSISSKWLDDDEEIAEIHRSITRSESDLTEVMEGMSFLQTTFDEQGNYENTNPVYPFVAEEVEKLSNGNSDIFRAGLYQILQTLGVIIKADEISVEEAVQSEHLKMPAIVVYAFLLWLRDVGLVLYDADKNTFTYTANAVSFLKELNERMDKKNS